MRLAWQCPTPPPLEGGDPDWNDLKNEEFSEEGFINIEECPECGGKHFYWMNEVLA